jgi:hypothetical protein
LKAPRNSCSASWARAGVVHQNDGGEVRTGMRRDLMRRRVLDGLMPGCRGCASFREISGAGYHYRCSHPAAMQGSQAALKSRRWAASRRVLRGPRWYCQTGGCNVMRQGCPSDWPMLELMMLVVGRSWVPDEDCMWPRPFVSRFINRNVRCCGVVKENYLWNRVSIPLNCQQILLTDAIFLYCDVPRPI